MPIPEPPHDQEAAGRDQELQENFIFLTSYLDAYQSRLGITNTSFRPTSIDRYLGLSHNSIIKKLNKIDVDFLNYQEAYKYLSRQVQTNVILRDPKKEKKLQINEIGKEQLRSIAGLPDEIVKAVLDESKKMQRETNHEIRMMSQNRKQGGRSELEESQTLEDRIIKQGANSLKEAKAILRKELIDAYPDRFID